MAYSIPRQALKKHFLFFRPISPMFSNSLRIFSINSRETIDKVQLFLYNNNYDLDFSRSRYAIFSVNPDKE